MKSAPTRLKAPFRSPCSPLPSSHAQCLRRDLSLTLLLYTSLKALNERLQTLGLRGRSEETVPQFAPVHSLNHNHTHDHHPEGLRSAFLSPTTAAHLYTQQQQPSVVDLRPSDSISMYQRRRGGGTNVDDGEGLGTAGDVHHSHHTYAPDDGTRYDVGSEEDDGVTRGTERPGESVDAPTFAPTSQWTKGSL